MGAPGVVLGWVFWAKAAVAAKTTRTRVAPQNIISGLLPKIVLLYLGLHHESMGETVERVLFHVEQRKESRRRRLPPDMV
jgi:hypothetical protein